MQLVRSVLNAALAALVDTGAPLDPAAVWVGIYTSVVDHGVDTVIGDVTAPPTADYPRQPITTWGAVHDLVDGSPVVDSGVHTFSPPDNTHPTTVNGIALYDALTAGNLIGFLPISPAVNLALTTDSWSVVVRPMLDAQGRWDVSVSWDG